MNPLCCCVGAGGGGGVQVFMYVGAGCMLTYTYVPNDMRWYVCIRICLHAWMEGGREGLGFRVKGGREGWRFRGHAWVG